MPRSVHAAVCGLSAMMCFAACGRPSADAETQPPAVPQVTEHGVGPVRIGMTLAEARVATKQALSAPADADTAECSYANWKGGPAGVRMMTSQGRIVRVDVDSAITPTAAGARIGDSESRIAALYPGRVETTAHSYTTGHYLTISPATRADSAYRIIFETDGKRVTVYRAGKLPEVAFIEGCG